MGLVNNEGASVKQAGQLSARFAALGLAIAGFTHYATTRPNDIIDNPTEQQPNLATYTQKCLLEAAGHSAITGETNSITAGNISIDRAWVATCIKKEHAKDIDSEVKNGIAGKITGGIAALLCLGVAGARLYDRRRIKSEPNAHMG